MTRHARFVLLITLTVLVAAGAGAARAEAGRDLLAGRTPVYALAEKGAAWQKELAFEKGGLVKVRARWTFDVPDPAAWVGFLLKTSPEANRLLLNGRPVPVPVEGMRYNAVPGIPPAALSRGTNTLDVEWTVGVSERDGRPSPPKARMEASLVAMTPDMLAADAGPVLGQAGADFFAVACRTNLPAKVTLEVDGRRWIGPEGFVHSFKADGLKPGTAYPYRLVAELADGRARAEVGAATVRTLPAAGAFSFAAVGDSRSHPKDWARVAAAVVETKPAFVAFTGDMISDGRRYDLWEKEFFGPAPAFFATLPTFYVLGNHERRSPLFGTLLPVPGVERWAQSAGPVLLIGIDGAGKWGEGSENLAWLEETLKAADEAKYIFLLTHYPAWSSGPHGGRGERAMVEGRTFILPLLKKYGGTAMLAGHDHCYERSEPPDGVTVIITGGAGAPLYGKAKDAEQQNPHSKAFARAHHFCLFTVTPEACTLRALTPEGEEIDTHRWPPRR